MVEHKESPQLPDNRLERDSKRARTLLYHLMFYGITISSSSPMELHNAKEIRIAMTIGPDRCQSNSHP